MSIKELSTPADYVANFKKVRHGSGEAQEAWSDRQAKRREKQTVIAEVAEGCSIETVRGTTLRDGEEVTPADVGGASNLDRLRRVGAVNMITENQLKTNSGGFEFVMTTGVSAGARIYDKGEGFNAAQLDQPAGEPYETFDINTRRIVRREGRPAVVGSELAESLIERGLAERRTLRAKVAANFRKRRKAAADAEIAD